MSDDHDSLDAFAFGGREDINILIAEEERARTLACVEREKAESACNAEGRSWLEADHGDDPIFDETHRLEDIACDLHERIIRWPAASVGDVLAKAEWGKDNPDITPALIADLRRLA